MTMQGTTVESVKVPFSPDEIGEMQTELVNTNIKVAEWESEKALTSSHLGTLIKEGRSKTHELSLKIRNGFEMREIPCRIVYDEPQLGWKQIVDADTGEVIRTAEMTREEQMQQRLDFEGRRGE